MTMHETQTAPFRKLICRLFYGEVYFDCSQILNGRDHDDLKTFLEYYEKGLAH